MTIGSARLKERKGNELSFLLRRPRTNIRIRLAGAINGGPPGLRMRPLETERLLLRRVSQEDRGEISGREAWANTQHGKEIEAQKFLDFCFREYRESRMGPWGILLKYTGLLVGNCGFPHISFKQSTGEINYYVAPRYRGQGLATEAVMALLEFGFGDMGLNRIQGRCAPDKRVRKRYCRGRR